MDKLIITVLGIIFIIVLDWYFLLSRRRKAGRMAERTGNVQEIQITVKGGYSPDVIVVRKGIPVRLNFYRAETDECSETVVFGDFNIRKDLPAFRTTAVEFTPLKEGEYVFTCGMGMLRGRLVVR